MEVSECVRGPSYLVGQAKDKEEEVVGLYIVSNALWTLEELPRQKLQHGVQSGRDCLLVNMGFDSLSFLEPHSRTWTAEVGQREVSKLLSAG